MDLQEYIENPKVLYIYETGIQIYGLMPDSPKKEYTIICKEDFENFEETKYIGETILKLYKIEDWFQRVINGDLIAWECACLPKKYVIKEHVKLMMTTNPLQLRKGFDTLKKKMLPIVEDYLKQEAPITAQQILFNLHKYIKFANQIIENHKIVNFKEVAPDYRNIVTGELTNYETLIENWSNYIDADLTLFKKYTDELLRLDKIKKIIQS